MQIRRVGRDGCRTGRGRDRGVGLTRLPAAAGVSPAGCREYSRRCRRLWDSTPACASPDSGKRCGSLSRADLLAVLSEGLTNVARHARASCADVDLTETPDRLIIEITDDGIGIGRAPGRSGLATMRRRAVAHDGAFSVEPWQPSGTRLTWTVPLQRHGELAVTERARTVLDPAEGSVVTVVPAGHPAAVGRRP
jgi:hypothetical protein